MAPQWTDFEKQQQYLARKKNDDSQTCVTCKKCSSQWFEEITLNKYQLFHNNILGQSVPPKPGSPGYKFLRCIVCSNVLEPRLMRSGRDLINDDYDHLLDTMEGKFDIREKQKKEEEKQNNANISAEEL